MSSLGASDQNVTSLLVEKSTKSKIFIEFGYAHRNNICLPQPVYTYISLRVIFFSLSTDSNQQPLWKDG